MNIENYERNLHKAAALCSVRECCTNDIRQKLAAYGCTDEEAERIICRLIEEKFLDDQRYATAYAKDKFRFGRWGRVKIGYMLRAKKVSDMCIQNALGQIDEEEYTAVLRDMLREKAKSVKAQSDYERNGRLFRFAASRGFEGGLIQEALKGVL